MDVELYARLRVNVLLKVAAEQGRYVCLDRGHRVHGDADALGVGFVERNDDVEILREVDHQSEHGGLPADDHVADAAVAEERELVADRHRFEAR